MARHEGAAEVGVARVIGGTGGEAPGEFQVFPLGRVEMEGGEAFVVDREGVGEVMRRFDARGIDMVIDYEHQTEGGSWSGPEGKAPAAGWIKQLVDRGEDGLWAVVEWTERAKAHLASREYRYYSPVFLTSGKEGRLVELLRVALTNAPRMNRIRPVVAKGRENQKKDGGNMDKAEFVRVCAKKLGLPEGATEEEVAAAIGKTGGKDAPVVMPREALDALGLPETAGVREVVASVHAMRQRPDLTAEVAALKRRLAERERDEAVEAAIRAGKITAAQKEWAEGYALTDLEGFRLFVAKAPRVVSSEDLFGAGAARGVGEEVLDEGQRAINRMMGVDDEAWKKHGPKTRG